METLSRNRQQRRAGNRHRSLRPANLCPAPLSHTSCVCAEMKPEIGEPSELYVFVHGVFRSGYSHHRHLEKARYLGKGRTKEQFALYVGVHPYVVKSEKVSWIVGEVYEVDKRTLRRLDFIEQCPCWHFREWVDVMLDDGQELKAMMYFARERKRHLVLSGDYNTG